MTQNEFEERIGRDVTGDEFERANDIYCRANLTKTASARTTRNTRTAR